MRTEEEEEDNEAVEKISRMEKHANRWSQGKTFLYEGLSWLLLLERGDPLLNQDRIPFAFLWTPICLVKCFAYK